MILSLLSVIAFVAVVLYFGPLKTRRLRMNRQSWSALIAGLRHDWSARELSDQFLWKEGLSATPEEAWERIHGAHGLWAMFQNAQSMVEMAEFAARTSDAIEPSILETLRDNAEQIRLYVLKAVDEYASSQATESVQENAFCAAFMYTRMAARMTRLLQDHAATALPDFVAAM